ncbi:MAG: hypothetical protein RMK84_04770 [Oscillochloridaceae bacterium]|nr:hypothetical protein [Chloroflexaceae bacterium]MDW8389417.1 hypothetical protein [Oscillochloridaceae bacterium]
MPLNPYAEAARQAIAAHLPELLPALREEEDGSLLVELRSPSGRQFWLSTSGDEITVGFDLHHRHFGNSAHPDAEDDVAQASAYIRNLMSGRYRIAVWKRGEHFVMSETLEEESVPAVESRSWGERRLLRGCSVEVYGW